MHEILEEQDDSREYEGYWQAGGDEPKAQGNRNFMDLAAARNLNGRNSSGSNSRPNSGRNVQQNEPTYNDMERQGSAGRRHSLGIDERPAPGLAPRAGSRHSLGATSDQVGLYQQPQQPPQFRDRPSRSLGSTADLPPVYQPLPRERPQPDSWNRRMPEVEL